MSKVTKTHLIEIPQRRADWGVRWIEFIKDSLDLSRELVIDWDSRGVTCFSWAMQGVEELTGVNPHDQWLDKYTNVLGICKLLKKYGYTSLDQYIADLFPEVPVGMAQQGDLVLIRATHWVEEAQGEEYFAGEMMPHGVGLVEPPFYYIVTDKGLAKGDLYKDGVRAFAVGREV